MCCIFDLYDWIGLCDWLNMLNHQSKELTDFTDLYGYSTDLSTISKAGIAKIECVAYSIFMIELAYPIDWIC